jgi:hypothetical protein
MAPDAAGAQDRRIALIHSAFDVLLAVELVAALESTEVDGLLAGRMGRADFAAGSFDVVSRALSSTPP